jgi:hypothetical protein
MGMHYGKISEMSKKLSEEVVSVVNISVIKAVSLAADMEGRIENLHLLSANNTQRILEKGDRAA